MRRRLINQADRHTSMRSLHAVIGSRPAVKSEPSGGGAGRRRTGRLEAGAPGAGRHWLRAVARDRAGLVLSDCSGTEQNAQDDRFTAKRAPDIRSIPLA
jgi:hypothetical protein